MSVFKLVWRIAWKVVAVILIVAVGSYLASPVLTNQIAMTQMENSNELYILFSNFANLKTVLNVISIGAGVGLAVSIESDIREFAKSVKSRKSTNNIENEKEN